MMYVSEQCCISKMTYIVSGGALNSTHSLTNWICYVLELSISIFFYFNICRYLVNKDVCE